jgi:hypothetical protein
VPLVTFFLAIALGPPSGFCFSYIISLFTPKVNHLFGSGSL